MSAFSDRINDIMRKRNITQKQLAELANVTESAMSYYVNGTRTPRIQVLSRLAGVLGVTTDYLLGTDSLEPDDETQYQYLERNLKKLNPEQLEKAEKVLRAVFEDVFDEKAETAEKSGFSVNDMLCCASDFLYAEGNPAAKTPAVIKSFLDVAEFDKTGIVFTDGSKIDFQECTENTCASSTCVGARDYFADPPFFEFLTSGHPTRILFCSSKSLFSKKQKNKEMFIEFQRRLRDYKFTTYDLG